MTKSIGLPMIRTSELMGRYRAPQGGRGVGVKTPGQTPLTVEVPPVLEMALDESRYYQEVLGLTLPPAELGLAAKNKVLESFLSPAVCRTGVLFADRFENWLAALSEATRHLELFNLRNMHANFGLGIIGDQEASVRMLQSLFRLASRDESARAGFLFIPPRAGESDSNLYFRVSLRGNLFSLAIFMGMINPFSVGLSVFTRTLHGGDLGSDFVPGNLFTTLVCKRPTEIPLGIKVYSAAIAGVYEYNMIDQENPVLPIPSESQTAAKALEHLTVGFMNSLEDTGSVAATYEGDRREELQ